MRHESCKLAPPTQHEDSADTEGPSPHEERSWLRRRHGDIPCGNLRIVQEPSLVGGLVSRRQEQYGRKLIRGDLVSVVNRRRKEWKGKNGSIARELQR